MGNNLVALCDVDPKRAGNIYQKHPAAKRYQDFRKMFDEMEKGIDAVLVATPDHTHAVAAVAAMKLGKHVYCEKPLTRTVHEARVMRETAARQKVVTQMGNQGSAENRLRRAVELVWGGVIGEVREAHVWFDGGNGPMKRPDRNAASAGRIELGFVARTGGVSSVQPGVCSCELARLAGVWQRDCRRFRLSHREHHVPRSASGTALAKVDESGRRASVIIELQAWPSERDLEGYPTSSKTVMDLPARGRCRR